MPTVIAIRSNTLGGLTSQVNAALAPLLDVKIISAHLDVRTVSQLVKAEFTMLLETETGGVPMTDPFQLRLFTGGTIEEAAFALQQFIDANPTYFFAPAIQGILEYPRRPIIGIITQFYTEDAANGINNWFAPFLGASGGGGEVNTASNLAAEGLFSAKVGPDLRFKGVTVDTATGLAVASSPSQVTVSQDWSTLAPQLTLPGSGDLVVFDPNGSGDFRTLSVALLPTGSPGGADTQIQFNDSGSFGGSADLTWDDTAKEFVINGKLTVTGLIDPTGMEFIPQVANPGGVAANTIWIDSGTNHLMRGAVDLEASVAVTSVFTRTGAVVAVSGDYSGSLVTNDSGVAGATVSDALDTLDSVIGGLGPAGANTQIQFNASGSFGASADFAWDDTGKELTANGVVLVAAGTAADPAYSFIGDTDTGWYHAAANHMCLSTGGTQKLCVNSDTTTSWLPLVVTQGTISTNTRNIQGTATWDSGVTTFTGWEFDVIDTASAALSRLLALRVGSADRFVVTKDGSIAAGIGTAATPGYRFVADPDTGIYGDGSDTLSIATGGANRFTIDSTDAVFATSVTINGKLTVTGLIDPTGLEYEPVAANPGGVAANTTWIDTGDSRLKIGANTLAYLSEVNGAPGGADTNIQFNDSGSFGGSADFTWNDTTKVHTINGVTRGSLGGISAPTYSFLGDTNTGIFSPSADIVAITTDGVQRWSVSTANVVSTLAYLSPDGTVGLPTYSFTNDSDTGMYRIGTNHLGLATNGVLRLGINATAITATLGLLVPDGTFSVPAYSFTSDQNSGMYSAGVDAVGIAVNGTEVFLVETTGVTVNGKLTVTGLIDPTGLEYTQVAANPGGVAANTTWIDSGDSRLKVGANTLAYLSEVSGGTPAGANTQVQYNNAGAFGASAKFTWNNTTEILSLTGAIRTSDGAVGATAYGFASAPSTGMYSIGGTGIGLAISGTNRFNLNATSLVIDTPLVDTTGRFRAAAGSAAAPALSFTTDNSGWWLPAGGTIGFASSGTETFRMSSVITTSCTYRGPNGTVAAPVFTFSSNTNTGMYRFGADTVGFAAGGVAIMQANATTVTIAGKLTVTGLIDPTGLEYTQVAANPGGVAANTTWIDSGDGRLKVGANTLAYLSEIGGGGTPGGANTQVQYNNAGAFGGSANFAWNNAGQILSISGVQRMSDGTISAPSYSFTASPNTGVYSPAVNQIGISVAGTNRFSINTNLATITHPLTVTGVVRAGAGTVSGPGYAFATEADTGWWLPVSGTIAFASTGAETFRMSSVITTSCTYRGPNGTVAAPTFTFSSDTNTGMYRFGADSIGFSAGGTAIMQANATTVTIAGKLTVTGLIDPTGLEYTQVAANPGGVAANTTWIDSADGRLKVGANTLAYLSEIGGGGTPGGADTNIQFNDSGSFGGSADFLWNDTTKLLTVSGAQSIAQAAITDPALALSVATTWNDAADTFTATRIGITDTASAFDSYALDVVVSASTVARIQKTGRFLTQATDTSGGYGFIGDTDTYIYDATSDDLRIVVGGVEVVRVEPTTLTTEAELIARNTVLIGGTAARTTGQSELSVTAEWDNAADTFTAFFIGITDTDSAAGSLLADFRTDTTSMFSVSKDGDVYIAGKLTVVGLIDPTGMEFTQVAANPGGVAADTLWISTGDGRLRQGSNVIAYASEAGGSPGGADRSIQFNNAGDFGGASPAIDTDGNIYGTGFAKNEQSGGTYTLQASDNGKILYLSNALAVTLTLPQQSTLALPQGFSCTVVQGDAGSITVTTQGTDALLTENGITQTNVAGSAINIQLRTDGAPRSWWMGGSLKQTGLTSDQIANASAVVGANVSQALDQLNADALVPAGANGAIQFRNGAVLAANAGLAWNDGSSILQIVGTQQITGLVSGIGFDAGARAVNPGGFSTFWTDNTGDEIPRHGAHRLQEITQAPFQVFRQVVGEVEVGTLTSDIPDGADTLTIQTVAGLVQTVGTIYDVSIWSTADPGDAGEFAVLTARLVRGVNQSGTDTWYMVGASGISANGTTVQTVTLNSVGANTIVFSVTNTGGNNPFGWQVVRVH